MQDPLSHIDISFCLPADLQILLLYRRLAGLPERIESRLREAGTVLHQATPEVGPRHQNADVRGFEATLPFLLELEGDLGMSLLQEGLRGHDIGDVDEVGFAQPGSLAERLEAVGPLLAVAAEAA